MPWQVEVMSWSFEPNTDANLRRQLLVQRLTMLVLISANDLGVPRAQPYKSA